MEHRAGRILIVEDEGIVATDIKSCLEDSGFVVTGVAASADDAIHEASATRPDLALMDIRIQGEPDGIELAGLLERRFGVPTVYLTAHGDNDTIERAKKTYPLGFLVKPFEPAELVNAVGFALEKVGAERRERERREAALREREDLLAERAIQLEAAHADALSEKNRLRAVMETLPVGVAFVDAEGRSIQANAAFGQIWGSPRPPSHVAADGVGYEASWADTGRPVQPTEWASMRAIQNGETVVGQEIRIVRPDGTSGVILNSAAPIRGAHGEILGSVVAIMDITERKLLEEERERQTQLKDEFLALLGHELRNPLAAISTAMHLLAGGVTAERRASLDQMVRRQVAVLQRLVDDLLDVARISHGQIELKREPIDLAEFLHRVARAAGSSIVGRGQEMLVRLPPERVLFMADGVRLDQVAGNLLNNASKYTGKGGRIELSGDREGSEVIIRCKDNGPGIPLELQKTIFEPFTRVQMSGQSAEAGVGIGLALVKRLVELHGGRVTVRSGGPDTGSEFVVRLPLEEPPSVPATVREARRVARPRRALFVAVVEDNPDVAQSLVIGLEQAGHKVTRFADAPSALSGLTGLQPAAILVDIGLPGMDGYELAGRLRNEQNLKHTLFVGLSGFKRRAAEGAGDAFDHYFVKPVDLVKLQALLETHGTTWSKSGPRSRVAKIPKGPRSRGPG